MNFNNNGDFIVGKTTLDTRFKVRVLTYEVSLPEINSYGPIATPVSVSVSTIINWLERGIILDFSNIKEEESVYYFLLEYNKYANQINNEEKREVLKLSVKALEFLRKDLKYELPKIDKPSTINPFAKKKFVSTVNKDVMVNGSGLSKEYNNITIQNKFKNTNDITRTVPTAKNKNMEDIKMYDMFDNKNLIGNEVEDGVTNPWLKETELDV